jgi:hypothetical protein
MEYQTIEIETESRLSAAKFTDPEQIRDTEQANNSQSISVSSMQLSRPEQKTIASSTEFPGKLDVNSPIAPLPSESG